MSLVKKKIEKYASLPCLSSPYEKSAADIQGFIEKHKCGCQCDLPVSERFSPFPNMADVISSGRGKTKAYDEKDDLGRYG